MTYSIFSGYEQNAIIPQTIKMRIFIAFVCAMVFACAANNYSEQSSSSGLPLTGTWKLLSGTLIEKGDTTVTDYTKTNSFIKIINETHFAFLHHDENKGKDSVAAVFSAGGGSYTLKDSTYKEHLEYCTTREWEGHDFEFTVVIRNDTLIQS